MSSGYSLPPSEHAAFAVTSRLLSCLVTEGLLRAFYVPIDSDAASGALVVLSTHLMSEHPVIDRALRPRDVFAIVPLRHAPMTKGSTHKQGQAVGLVDPLDMLPQVYELSEAAPADNKNVGPLLDVALPQLTFPSGLTEERDIIPPHASPLGTWPLHFSFGRTRACSLVEQVRRRSSTGPKPP